MAIADFTGIPLAELISLKGRRAVVTGAAQRTGLAIANRLAEAGASVILGDIDVAKVTEAANSIAGGRKDMWPCELDVASEASVMQCAAFAEQKMGGIDIWINNAGIFPRGSALEMDGDTWDHIQDVNLKGVFIGAREAAKRMIAQGTGGVIVNLSSMSGFRARANMAHYVAAKTGVIGLTRALALEFGPMNIRVLGIAPALILEPGRVSPPGSPTEFPLGRPSAPDDIARVALFCASDLSAMMSGSTLKVDAGDGAGIFAGRA